MCDQVTLDFRSCYPQYVHMSKRTAEREQFLADVITTAVEGGIGYWSQTSQYQYHWDFNDPGIRVAVGERDESLPESAAGTTITIHRLLDDESGYEDEGRKVTIDSIARALGMLKRAEKGKRDDTDTMFLDGTDLWIGPKWAARLLGASTLNDAGELDAADADALVQLAVLGVVAYG